MGEEGYAMTPGATIPGLAGTVSSTTSPSTSPSTSPPASLHPSNPPSSSRSHLHAHRQSHNSSKLPAFRFADRDLNKQQSLPLPALPQPSEQSQLSSAPVSPNSGVIDLDAPPSGIYLSDNMSRGASTGSRRSSRSSNSSSSSSHSASQPPNPMHVSGVASAGLRNHPPRTTSKSTRSSRHSGRDSPDSGGGAPAGVQDHSQSPREIENTTRIGTSNSIPRMTTHHAPSSQQHQHQNQQQPAQDTRQTSTSYPPRTRFSKRDSIPEDHELSPPRTRPRSRASTLQTSPQPTFATTPATSSSTRPSSLPHSPAAAATRSREHASPDVAGAAETPSAGAKTQHRRAPASNTSNGLDSTADHSPSLNTHHRLQSIDTAHSTQLSGSGPEHTTKEWAQGQRELLLPKTLQSTTSTEEKRQTVRSRPPLSFRAPSNTSASVRVAPIRSFRSSGSRRSFGLDMNSPSTHAGDSSGDDYSYTDSNQRDRTLRALEGRPDDEMIHDTTPPDSARRDHLVDGDDTTGDVFMKIAREEPRRRAADETSSAEDPRTVTRVTRSSHRRPLSVAVPSSYQSTSPPRVTRRLSDQQETSRSRSRLTDDRDATEAAVRDLPYRGLLREKGASSHPGEDARQARLLNTGYRNSPTTPRSLAFQDSPADSSSYSRRRTSVTDSNPGPASRNAAYRQSHLAYGHSRTFNSSPLASRQAEPHRHDTHHEVQPFTRCWTSAPPLPPTRPFRLHQNTTTETQQSSVTPPAPRLSQREAQPLLFSAINRTKPLLSAEVSKALETAATEAVALVVMMGTAGQPGPISSGASTVGAGTNLTDRQLRRRAEGVCRSLTELVLALSEEATQPQNKTVTIKTSGSPQKEGPTTPTITKSFPRLDIQRRGSVTNNDAPATTNEPSPRAMSKLEERRSTMLNSTALPSPRFALAPAVSSTPTEASHGVARKSSLFIGRTRRAATEEPEEGRRSSMLLRTRRAGTEEPEEGRKTSLLRERRGTNEHDDDEPRFRAPSRAQTEVAQNRAASHHFQTQPLTLDPSSNSSALPRRRIGSSALNPSRLASPSTPSALGGRRYFERSTPDRDGNSVADKLAEERGQRHLSLGQNSLLNRTASFLRRPNRESMANASTSAQTGAYR
ncbi:conserved hypothetical protein [Verticillium alfalfae VaMs.102]|uniref:LPXTG-motif cell wall anchor domain-containing protein n=1 Tax=Verticillium alfalfae (strain VaMs.102 / ATCC MYA-4576 / FGSC 10136) TaxID=526221 RepID=C9SVB4_VERA1|nr:conserved hypothetical protein [Verticillium alfalfae VaMs.102]EEY22729.1 conserved hypothetical protein [Verticillium alfalfae VaMs.102]